MSSISGLQHGTSSMMRSSWTRMPAMTLRLAAAASQTPAIGYHNRLPTLGVSGQQQRSFSVLQSVAASSSLSHKLAASPSPFSVSQRYLSDESEGVIKVKLPALSPTMEMGTIISWQAKQGAKLNEGDLLCEIETDKATMGFETPEEGYLAKILIPEGSKDVPIGKLLCIIVADEADVSKYADYTPTTEDDTPTAVGGAQQQEAAAPPPPPPPPAAAPAAPSSSSVVPPSNDMRGQPDAAQAAPAFSAPPPAPAAPQQQAAPGQRVKASPFAKKLAYEKGVDLQGVSGSGPGGRIIAADVSAAPAGGAAYTPAAASVPPPLSTGQAAGAYTDVAISAQAKAHADRLSWSKQNIPHYYLTTECDLTQSISALEKLNRLLAQRHKGEDEPAELEINDLVVKAAALACLKVPEANSFWMDTHLRQNHSVDVTLIVQGPDSVQLPVLRSAHTKGLSVINRETQVLTARAEAGQLEQQEVEGGTFAIQCLSDSDVAKFATIILPPQSCVLAVGAPNTKMLPDQENIARAAQVVSVTLSCDHRVVDGAVGAQWLQAFRGYIEKPHTMLL